ncbi:MAG TPA: branched-chain amino acid ABC transporter substrate-binding protein [Anaerolineae bacterium]
MNRRILSTIAATTLLVAACQNTPTPAPTSTVDVNAPTVEPTTEPDPTATPIPKGTILKLYSSLPLTGARSEEAKSVVNAITLALDQHTDSGTLCNGLYKITYESLDDATAAKGGWDTLTEQANAYKANADADAMAYIGPLDSGAARVSAPVLEQTSLAMFSPGADYIGLTRPYAPSDPQAYFPAGKRNFMRLATPLDVQGAAAAEWVKSLGVTSVLIVDDEEQYGYGVSDAFEMAAKKAGLQVTGRDAINLKSGNLLALAGRAMNVDLVFFGGADPKIAGQFLAQMRKAGAKARFMGTSVIMTKDFADAAGDAAEGVYAFGAGVSLDALSVKGKQFVQDFQARFSVKPSSAAVYGYEAASVALATMGKVCLKDRVALLDAMFKTQDFDGVLGKWSFDANGDISLTSELHYILQKGAWQVQ